MNRFIPSWSWLRRHEHGIDIFMSLPLSVSPCICGKSESCLDARGEGAEVTDSLDLVIRQLDVEVVFEAREQFKRLQAVDPELLVEIVAGLEAGARHLEVRRRQIQDFVGRLFKSFHERATKNPLFILQEDGACLRIAQGKFH